MKIIVPIIVAVAIATSAVAQDSTARQAHKRTLLQKATGRHYVPVDLEDCFVQINSFWADSVREKVKNREEEDFVVNAHFGFGMWIRNNWGLWRKSRLAKYFNELGIFHPDDMSGIILTSYHRYLNDKPLLLEEQIKYYQDYWEEARKQQEKIKEVQFVPPK